MVRHDELWAIVSFHRTFQKLDRGFEIPALCGENFEHFAFMIDRMPEILYLAIDVDEHPVQMPAPLVIGMALNATLAKFRGEHRTEPVPPELHSLLAVVDTALE